ncbi:MAG: ABC transporter permease [Deltaproteobacteria bacterium]|jgi:general nucleoside transport system permease protein|nr:ABC transporter permease [Deltaproteobacteria bacterium]
MDTLTLTIGAILFSATSLIYATIGEILTERSGILNLGLEGLMMMGALSGFAVCYHTHSLFLSVIVALIVGALMSSIHAFLTITMKASQVVSGLSLTIFGVGLANFLGERLGPESNSFQLTGLEAPRFEQIAIPFLHEIPIIGPVFHQDLLTYIVYLLIPLSWFFVYKTKYGLELQAVGENPRTAEAMGINVIRLRYIYTIVGGMLVSLGGSHLTLSYMSGWNENKTDGRGWIVIALVIFAMWDPKKAILGALLFGGISALQLSLQAGGITFIPASFLDMLPYLATVLVLICLTIWEIVSKRKFGAPASLGVNFMREEK